MALTTGFTARGEPAAALWVSIGTTAPAPISEANSVLPLGVMASRPGAPGTGMGVPAPLDAVEMGVTAVGVVLAT
jgi:hypothetical protein